MFGRGYCNSAVVGGVEPPFLCLSRETLLTSARVGSAEYAVTWADGGSGNNLSD